MNEIKITIELSEADRARVDRLITLAEGNQTVTRSTAEALVAWAHELDKAITRGVGAAEAAEEAQEAPTSPEEPALAETPAPVPDAPAAAVEPEKPAPDAVDRKTVKRLAVKKIQEGKRDAVKAVIASFGVEKVDQVPEEKLAELEKRLGEV